MANKETVKLVESKTRLYRIYTHVKRRCLSPSCDRYKYYGERGITICDEWKNSWAAFRDWSMANGYNDTLTIDRIDVNGNYTPDNCRWVNMRVQNNNRRDNHFITYNGETKTIAEWSRITGIAITTIYRRWKLGWTNEEILTERVRTINRTHKRAKDKIMCDCKECNKCPYFPEIHTTKEWAEMPDAVSVLGKWYVVSDYRTDNDVNVARFKFGDGMTMISKLPFVTAAITDNDVEMWDDTAISKNPAN